MAELINHIISNSIFRKKLLRRIFPNAVTYIYYFMQDLAWQQFSAQAQTPRGRPYVIDKGCHKRKLKVRSVESWQCYVAQAQDCPLVLCACADGSCTPLTAMRR